MPLTILKRNLSKLNNALRNAEKKGIDINKQAGSKLYDFKDKQVSYLIATIDKSIVDLKSSALKLDNPTLIKLTEKLDKSNPALMLKVVDEMADIVSEMKEFETETPKELKIKIPKMPADIRDDVVADLQELEKCFNLGCYRSATIICGRLLEIALHRKYYDITGFDILEKNPGIGLGTLVAKLSEKNVKFDPGLTQQIHLINQVRIFSVHKKQQAFYPSKSQAHAMILYTLDIMGKMF
ncbi:hypothetical protein KY339_04270 [Candidatus Woesearchaeota archaeon]|nr:hypothetical protein [Candidatus Woesearchaeota archaeon]